jgi:MraZ protein
MLPAFGAKPHKLDFAARLKLREEERRELGKALVIARGFDHRLRVYTLEGWAKLVAEYEKLPANDSTAQDLYDFLIASGEQCEVDAQGRVRVPDPLLAWAGLGGGNLEAYLVKGRDCWQIWDVKNYQEFCERADQLKPVLAQYFGGAPTREGSAAA